MAVKRVLGIFCLAPAAYLIDTGLSTVPWGNSKANNDRSGSGVIQAVAAYLPALPVAVVGLWLLKKPRR